MTTKKQDEQQNDWEDEGGSTAEPTQKTPTGLEIRVPKRHEVMDALRWVVKPKAKPKP